MLSKGQKIFLFMTVLLAAFSPLVAELGAQPLVQRGGIDVNPPRVKFSLDFGVGLSGIGEAETSLVFSLTPRYEFWRRGEIGLDLALPVLFLSEANSPHSDGLESTLESAVDVAPSLELGLPSFALDTDCCMSFSLFVGAGFRFLSGPESDEHPLVTAGAALEVRPARNVSTRFELRITNVSYDRREDETSGLVTIGLGFGF